MEHLPGLTPEDWSLAESILGLTKGYLLERYDDPNDIPECHLEWWALCLSESRQVAIAAPREHAKSTAITFAYVIFLLIFKVTRHLLILSSNEEIAGSFVNELKVEFQENDALKKEFGFQKFIKETETEIVIQWRDGLRSRVIAKGAGQRMRGLKWERKRPDYVVGDDVEDEELVLNDQRREKFRKWFYGTVRPIVKSGGKIRLIGTIIGFDSLLERTMPKEKKETTVVEPLRTYSKEPDGWHSVKYRAHDPNFEHVLWPARWPKEKLQAMRKEFSEMGMLDIYGQEYLNNPLDEKTRYFRQSDLLAMTDEDRSKRKTYYAAADFAIGETERSAYSVIIVGGMDSEGFMHIVDVRRGRWDGLEIIEEMFSVQLRWEPEAFRVESENIAKSLGPFLFAEMGTSADKPFINIDDKPPTKDKDKRARSIQARTRAGRVKLDKEADWYPDFEEEITKYPKYAYKDQFDAFAWLGLMLEEMDEPATKEEDDEEEYHRQVDRYMPMGRNQVTGY